MKLPNMGWIYTLEHGQTAEIEDWKITRVPGGWIYRIKSTCINTTDVMVFVPFNNEFQKE